MNHHFTGNLIEHRDTDLANYLNKTYFHNGDNGYDVICSTEDLFIMVKKQRVVTATKNAAIGPNGNLSHKWEILSSHGHTVISKDFIYDGKSMKRLPKSA